MSHSHNPHRIEKDGKVYANSGDWILNNSYLKIIDKKIELCFFES